MNVGHDGERTVYCNPDDAKDFIESYCCSKCLIPFSEVYETDNLGHCEIWGEFSNGDLVDLLCIECGKEIRDKEEVLSDNENFYSLDDVNDDGESVIFVTDISEETVNDVIDDCINKFESYSFDDITAILSSIAYRLGGCFETVELKRIAL